MCKTPWMGSLGVEVGPPMNKPTGESSNQPRPNYDGLASLELPNQLLPSSQASTNKPIILHNYKAQRKTYVRIKTRMMSGAIP